MSTTHLKKIQLHQGMVVDHVMGDGQFSSTDSLFSTGSMTTGVPILPLLSENLLVGGNGNLALNSLGNNWPIEPTNHNEFFPVPNLISNMFDGNKATAFRSLGPTSNKNSFLIFDFGREVLPGKIVITFPYLTPNPNFATGGSMQISFHDGLTSNNASEFKDQIFPLNQFLDSDIISTNAPADVYKARVYKTSSTTDSDPNKATSIVGDGEMVDTSLASPVPAAATINSINKVTFTANAAIDYLNPIATGFQSGKQYTVSATISGYSATGAGTEIGFSSQGGGPGTAGVDRLTEDGDISYTFTSDGNDLRIFAGSGIAGVISNMSIKANFDDAFILKEFIINNPTNTGDTEGTGVVMTRGRRYMTINFSNTTFSSNFGISNIEFFEKVNGLDYLKQRDVEFDDALLDLQGWKNPRYYGSKLTGKLINKFKRGDISYGKNPVVENKTTAMYIVDTVIGGTEDPQFSQIKAHSYLGIKQILIIDEQNETVEVIDRNSQDFESFQRYITTDFPTGGKFRARLIDNKAIQNNLKKDNYFVKFNKGYLLRAFNYKQTKTKPSGGVNLLGSNNPNFAIFNSIFLYGDNRNRVDLMLVQPVADGTSANYSFAGNVADYDFNLQNGTAQFQGTSGGLQAIDAQVRSGSLFFNFANSHGVFPSQIDDKMNPRFESSSIFENKFTKQYYSSSLGFIKDKPRLGSGHVDTKFLNSAFYKATKFIMLDTLKFLRENETTTELYLTLLQGSKDLAPGLNDERSIGLFEVSAETEITTFDNGMEFLPRRNELKLRGKKDDGRFYPTINGHTDNIRISYIEEGGVFASASTHPANTDTHSPHSDFISAEGSMFLQGGLLGSRPRFRPKLQGNPGVQVGNISDWTKENDYSGSYYEGEDSFNLLRLDSDDNPFSPDLTGSNNSNYNSYQESISSYYAVPQFDYDLSFLDKDHALIVNIDKETELFDGIGSAGLVLVPEQISPNLKFNIDYWLNKAGILDKKVKRTPRRPERGR